MNSAALARRRTRQQTASIFASKIRGLRSAIPRTSSSGLRYRKVDAKRYEAHRDADFRPAAGADPQNPGRHDAGDLPGMSIRPATSSEIIGLARSTRLPRADARALD